MAYEDYGFEHWDAHDYGEYEPDDREPEDDDGGDWSAEDGERFLQTEVYEPLGRRLRDGIG